MTDDKINDMVERLIGNSWDTYLKKNQDGERDWFAIADTILLDGRSVAEACRKLQAENADLRQRLDVCREFFKWVPSWVEEKLRELPEYTAARAACELERKDGV